VHNVVVSEEKSVEQSQNIQFDCELNDSLALFDLHLPFFLHPTCLLVIVSFWHWQGIAWRVSLWKETGRKGKAEQLIALLSFGWGCMPN